ncbi:3-octaprenyl-4-hydroxybenzoate carboxy-lyase [Thermodesulfatator indicus DSM 15286]|uniref:Flavin prenyltransferase UbiX n=1 Tax=Thermodesulfatator indicus (strain DSM 15286 / JCM 11887 / CIR29812) TaxID=667014 RepID=F8A910_THEID|nr:UbiX family flavin prenyltransferase [Thermodesulfatator indicus]AEH44060.1 3-octaprenyl-4-hydroxybenzoate carboxy-lyase [Thermodesulfatator indicus DSM 15286]
MKKVLVAITGASGSPYAVSFLKLLKQQGVATETIISDAGKKVLPLEAGLSFEELLDLTERLYSEHEIGAPPASGSTNYGAMVIVPCTMGTLAAIAHGLAKNLISRAADVMLKERRPLILVVRETPFNEIHLKNMLLAASAGATIYPAMPAFYHNPKNIQEMVDFFAKRLAEFLGIEIENLKRWRGLS